MGRASPRRGTAKLSDLRVTGLAKPFEKANVGFLTSSRLTYVRSIYASTAKTSLDSPLRTLKRPRFRAATARTLPTIGSLNEDFQFLARDKMLARCHRLRFKMWVSVSTAEGKSDEQKCSPSA